MKERFIATMIGTAIGDTLGMPVEGWKREQIKKYVGEITEPIDPFFVRDENEKILKKDEFGRLKYYSKDLKKGQYTDDTILALALAEALIEKGMDLDHVAQKQLHEYITRRMPDGKVKGGFGGTTKKAFDNLEHGISPLESGVMSAPGNAPAMKISPLGLYINATKPMNGLNFARQVGEITHQDPRSVVSGVIQAYAIDLLLQGIGKDEFLSAIEAMSFANENQNLKGTMLQYQGSFSERMTQVKLNQNISDDAAFDLFGASGTSYSSHPFALFMFQKYWNDPIDGMLKLINFGGDCDTTGAMYGALAGAKNGMIFPKSWVNIIDNKDYIIQVGEKLYKLGDTHEN